MAEKKLTLEELNNIANDLAGKVGLLNDRMRLIEERSHQNREKVRIVDENLLTKFKDTREDLKRLNIEVDSSRKTVDGVTKSLQRMVKELSNAAKLSDVQVIEKVLDFFDPTRFLTEKDVNRIISERMNQ